MKLTIDRTPIDAGSVRLNLNGWLVLGDESTGKLRDSLHACFSQGYRSLHIDMSEVRKIDAAGLGTLVAAHAAGIGCGTRVELGGLSPRIHHLLSLTKLLTVFGPGTCKKKAA